MTQPAAHLVSINVGRPRDVEWQGRTVRTAVWKTPVAGRVRVRRLNVDGDGQGDLAGHGGEQRAVFVYQLDSYRYWEKELGRSDFVPGQFGENFTVEGLSDDQTCIGDRFRIGGATFEVTQPRVTCYRVGIRMNEPRMPAKLTASGRPGFYFRVIEEGDVAAGDPIVKVANGEQRMSITEINALLYKPGHAREKLEQALRIQALSPGWRESFEALLREGPTSGNAGLVPVAAAHVAKPGFSRLRVTRLVHESEGVLSLSLEPADASPLTVPLPGQFVVLRLRPDPDAPPVFRSYSLSGCPSSKRYRLSVKLEPHGVAGTFLHRSVKEGDLLDVSAPRGAFVLREGSDPVVLVSAGIGATPVLAMLHALARSDSRREVWWLYGARNRESHPFAHEVRELMLGLANGRSHVVYSRPSGGRTGTDFDATGHLDLSTFEQLGVPRGADVYLCGPQRFLEQLRAGLSDWVAARERVHAEVFAGGDSMTPGVVGGSKRKPHLPVEACGQENADGPLVSFARSGLEVRVGSHQDGSLLELAEACDVPVRWSCRSGVCHSCECGLLSGDVRYDPQPLDAPAAGNVLPCCARPNGDVVLDL